jgi:hypothetical protein
VTAPAIIADILPEPGNTERNMCWRGPSRSDRSLSEDAKKVAVEQYSEDRWMERYFEIIKTYAGTKSF